MNNKNYSKYKKILDKYFDSTKEGITLKSIIILQYIFEFGDDIENFEEFVKKYKELINNIVEGE